jgi:hypothetical protein
LFELSNLTQLLLNVTELLVKLINEGVLGVCPLLELNLLLGNIFLLLLLAFCGVHI